jgi:hypothetical protein
MAAQVTPQRIQGPEVEEFLRTGKVLTIKDIGKGVTLPRKATMELNGMTGAGVFKIIDEKPLIGMTQLADGKIDSEFQDSWRTEVAAYELDKLVGLGMVPATVERRYDNTVGSMQFWVTSMMTEEKRQADKISPTDAAAWNDQMHKLFVWDNLIYNVDRNHGNILITSDWKIVAIDHSRTFRPYAKLKDPKLMVRFSRSMLAKLDALTEPMLKARLDDYLTPFQIQGVLKRRDLIAAYAKRLAKEKGDAAVYYQ